MLRYLRQMMRLKSRAALRSLDELPAMAAEDEVLFHRLGLVAAEVHEISQITGSINSAVDARIGEARGIAEDLRRAAASAEAFMGRAAPVDSLSGPRAARVLRGVRALEQMADRFEPRLRRHLEIDEGKHVDTKTLDVLFAFFGWIRGRGQQLRTRVRAFREEYGAALRADAEELERVAEVWAPALGDRPGAG